jgi:hypothetical protein
MQRVDEKSALVVVLLVVVAIGALAELFAGRAVVQSEAPRGGSWQVLAQAGDQARVRGDAPAARRAYLRALFLARGDRSIVGVLRAAEGFKALGDRDAVEHALRIAAALGPGDGPDVGARLQALRDRLDATDALPIAVRPAR